MSKRNKVKVASKTRKSALRVEALEQRQLLATITGSGTEVGSNIVHPNGNVYDQVLMTGSSVTVTADAGQITRVSFLDASGDIVQAEFAGNGTLTVSLANALSGVAPANYNQSGVTYMQGAATFTIQNSDALTNFSVFTVGQGNAINQSLFEGGKTGGNNVADVQAIVIVNNPLNPGNFTNFGGIRAGNAVFSGSSGNVGITAVGVNVQGPVIIGDVDASDVGVPVLNFGANSQFNTITVAGGDLVQTNNVKVLGGTANGIQSLNFTAGSTSKVESRPGFTTGTADITAKVNTSGDIFSGAEPSLATLDSITTIDLTGKTQAQIDALFKGRTFTNAITITGDLPVTNSIEATEFRGNVTFSGALSGNVTVTGDIKGTLTLGASNVGNTISANLIGGLVTTGTANLTGTVKSKSIGDVTVAGNLTGTITTDFDGGNDYDAGEKAIGKVVVGGNMSGSVYGILGIGDVSISGNLTTTGTALRTTSGTSGDAFLGNVGKVTISGDAIQGAGALIAIDNNGTFGDILISGGGTATAAHTVGTITVTGLLGGSGVSTGSITINDSTGTGATLTIGAISVGGANNVGSLGAINITSTAGSVTTGNITLGGTSNTGSIGAIAITGPNGATVGNIAHNGTGNIGALSVTSASGQVTVGTIDHTGAGGSLGNITLTGSGLNTSSVTFGNITLSTGTGGTTMGDITITNAEDINFGTITAKTIGAISATAVTVGAAPAATIDTSTITANNGTNSATIGAITLNAGTAGAVTIGGNITTNNTASNGTASIGAISLTGSTIAINNNIQSAKIGAVTHTGATTFASDKGYQALGGLESFTATGTTSMTAAAAANLRFGGTAGPALTFNGNTTFNTGTFPSILADNGGAALDRIASLTFNGKVEGVADKVHVRGSQIGDITIKAELATNESLVKNFAVQAVNNSTTSTATNAATFVETVARDGTNLTSNYTIGNVTIQSTNTIGISGTALLEGNNSIVAIGRIGNLNLQAGGSSAVQTALFKNNTDRAVFQVGNGALGATNASPIFLSGIDFDGNGAVNSIGATTNGYGTTITTAQENASTFSTNVAVSIGTITVNAAGSTTPGNGGSITGAGGAAATTNGLAILSAVKSDGTNFDANTLAVINTTAGSALRGTVGNVVLTNLSQQLQVNGATTTTAYANLAAVTDENLAGVIAAASSTTDGTTTTPFGTINGVTSADATATGRIWVVGGTDATATADDIVIVRL